MCCHRGIAHIVVCLVQVCIEAMCDSSQCIDIDRFSAAVITLVTFL